MTSAILRGKPCAGNPHEGFDEGVVVSAKSRRGPLLYKRMLMIVPLLMACAGWCEVRNLEDSGVDKAKELFVFKGLYLGMPVAEARKTLRSYGLDFSDDPSNDKDTILEYLSLSRTEIDVLFKTKGISAERFCKTLVTAYPVIKKFLKKTETVSDIQRQRKLMSDAGDSAFLKNVFSGVNPLNALSNASEARKRVYEDVKTMTKVVPVYYYESSDGFLLEIRPEQPETFFVLKSIAVVDIKNFN